MKSAIFFLVLLGSILLVKLQTVQVIQTAQNTSDLLTPKANIQFTENDFDSDNVITIDSSETYQEILGFGGALTESAASVYNGLNSDLQSQVLEAYYGEDGIGYTIGRMHIGSCDFALSYYNYDNTSDDYALDNFDISHDEAMIIPFIKDVLATNVHQMKLFATPWSPPDWMKGNHEMFASSTPGLINETDIYQSWALYLSKFVTAYTQAGIPVWGMTIQNEPENDCCREACAYTAEQQNEFLKGYLGPQMQQDHPNLTVMIYDHNKVDLPYWVQTIMTDPESAQYVKGTAFHWYSGSQFENVAEAHTTAPEKFVLATEACNCPVNPGDWQNGENYGYDIIGDLNNWSVGWVDWNILLNMQGGPSHIGANCDAPVLGDTDGQTLTFNPSFYYMGQISKFVPPGSLRVNVTAPGDLSVAGFVTPSQDIVVVVMNSNDNEVALKFVDGNMYANYTIPAHAITTFVYPESGKK